MLERRDFYQHLRNQGDHDTNVIGSLKELIYNGYHEDLCFISYYVNILIRRQQVEEVFKVLQEVIIKSNLPSRRKDSGYESDLESSTSSSQEIEQSIIYYPLEHEEIVKRITKTLINAGINIGTYKYEMVETPLHWAARENNINLINFFIEVGVDIEIQNKRRATVLHIAAINNAYDAIKELTKQKSNQELKKLIEEGSSKELLKQRLKINAKDDEGNTPLHLAVSCEDYNMVKSLLKAGANPNIFCPLGDDLYIQTPELQGIKCTPLQLAAFIGNIDIIELLINYKADVNVTCKSKLYSCLHMAVLGITCYYDEGFSEEKKEEYLEIVESLISQFPNQAHIQDYENNSPLHRAVSTKHEDTIKILLSHDAPLLQFRKGGYTPLHDAIAGGNLSIVKLLLESSSENLINSVCHDEDQPQFSLLDLAILNYIDCLSHKENLQNALKIIKYLLSYSEIDINIQDYQKETPLHYAIKHIKEDKIALELINELLTAKNINPFIKDSSRKTPFDYAKENNRHKILQAFIDNKYGPDQDSLLHLAAAVDEVKAVRHLIAKGMDVNLRNAMHHTPLHLAAGEGYANIVEILVEDGRAEVNIFDARNQTPLHYAVNNKRLKTVELLIKLKANVNAISADKNSTELSLLHIAVSNVTHDERVFYFDIIECLIKNPECKIDLQDYMGQTPLHYAISENKLNTAALLFTRKDINPFIKDAEGKTPIDYYIEQKKYNSPILDQYAEIQEERNAEIKSYKAKKYITCLLTLCVVNSVLVGIYASQYTLSGLILNIQNSGLMIITNIAALACCLITSKYIERSVEGKYRNKVAGLFSDHTQVEKQPNYVDIDFGSPIFNELSCIGIENFLQKDSKSRA